MDKNYLIQLTNNLYKLTLLFPKKEPLRYKIREAADDVLVGIIGLSPNPRQPNLALLTPTLEKLEILDGFFEVAKSQNWVPVVEVLRAQEEYSRIKAEIKKLGKRQIEDNPVNLSPQIPTKNTPTTESRVLKTESPKRPEVGPQDTEGSLISEKPARESGFSPLKERHKIILAFLKEQGRAQVWQVKKIFPEVTKRTLRRDFENLLKKGMVERVGERNETFYQVKYS